MGRAGRRVANSLQAGASIWGCYGRARVADPAAIAADARLATRRDGRSVDAGARPSHERRWEPGRTEEEAVANIGYGLFSEEHAAAYLVTLAGKAEQAGFAFATLSDHYHP